MARKVTSDDWLMASDKTEEWQERELNI